MFENGLDGGAGDVLSRLAGLVDELRELDLTGLPAEELLELLRDLETQRRRLASVDHELIGEIESRGVARERGCPTTMVLLRQILRITPRDASIRVRAAAELGPRRTLTGDHLPARFEAVAAAQVNGTISSEHARVITDTIDQLPAAIRAEHEDGVQAFLLEQAQVFDPRVLAQLAHRLRSTLDQDGTLAEEHDRARRRGLTVQQRPDGSAGVHGELTAICAEAVLAVLDSLALPAPAEDGTRDPRTAGQRRHDALQDGLLALLRSGQLPSCNGVAATILLTVADRQLRTQQGTVRTGHGAHISVRQALSLVGDARVLPITLSRTRAITGYGSSHRIFTENQRLAMAARDHGCSFPGCDVGAMQCQAHHVTDFSISRRTSVDDGTLLCGYHHREHAALGWSCHMRDGVPWWTPPPWIDPTGTPRRNHMHQPALV